MKVMYAFADASVDDLVVLLQDISLRINRQKKIIGGS